MRSPRLFVIFLSALIVFYPNVEMKSGAKADSDATQAVPADIRNKVIGFLGQIQDASKVETAVRGIVDLGPSGIDVLIDLLGVEKYRSSAMQVLFRVGSSAVPKLISTLDSDLHPGNEAAAEVLGHIDDPRKYPPLFTALKRNDQDLVYAALEAISNSDCPQEQWLPDRFETVIKLTRSNSEYLSSLAAKVLLRTGNLTAIDQLYAVLCDLGSRISEGYVSGDILRESYNFAHADVMRIFDLVELGKWPQHITGMLPADELMRTSRLVFYTDWTTQELSRSLQSLNAPSSFRAQDGSRLLMRLIGNDRSHELLLGLISLTDRSPSIEAIATLASLSPAKARSAVMQFSATNPSGEVSDLLVQLAEPGAEALLIDRIRDESDSEKWFPLTQQLGWIMRASAPEHVRAKLEAQQMSAVRIEAVLQASKAVQEKPDDRAPRFPLGVPPDYAMLSIVPRPTPEGARDSQRVFMDRLISSNALLHVLRQDPSGALHAIAKTANRSEPQGKADLIWALTRTRYDESTRQLRTLLQSQDLYLPTVVRELGRRRDRVSIPALLKIVHSDSDLACAAAAYALGEMRAREALPLLQKELARKDNFSKRDIAEAIVKIDGPAAGIGLIKRADNWGRVARQYLFYPLAGSGPQGEEMVLRYFETSLPEGEDAFPAGRALLASGRLSAALRFVRIVLDKRELFERKGYSITQQLLPVLGEYSHAPELVEPLASLAADERFAPWIMQGLARQPGEFADQVIMAAMKRGASPSRFREYLAKRPISGIAPLLKDAYSAKGRKSWDLETLVATGAPEALELVRDLLSEKGERAPAAGVFNDIVTALYKSPNQEGWELLPELYERLTERDRFVAVSEIPGRQATPELVRYLIRLLDHPRVETKQMTFGGYTLDFAAAAARALDHLDAKDAIPIIYQHWENVGVRDTAAMLVSRHADANTLARLVEVVRKRDYSVWRTIEVAMANAAASTPDAFSKLADDPDVEVRRKIAAACGRMRGDPANRTLLKLAGDRDPFVRSEAVAAMDRGPAGAFAKAVARGLRDGNEDVQREAVRVSGVLRIRDAMPDLRKIIIGQNPALAQEAARAFTLIDARSAERTLLEAAARRPSDVMAIRELGKLRSAASLPIMQRLVVGDDLGARQEAMRALGRIATPEAVAVLQSAYDDSQGYVKNYVEAQNQMHKQSGTAQPQPTKNPEPKDVIKLSPAYFPAQERHWTSETRLPVTGNRAHLFSYCREGRHSWVVWSRFERGSNYGDELWPVLLSQSDDGGAGWSSTETLTVLKSELSDLQFIPGSNQTRNLIFARGRQVFGGTWDKSGQFVEKAMPVGTKDSQTVKFNVLKRHDGSYLLFAAVGTPVPNNSLQDESWLVVLSSNDLSNWSAPVRIAPIKEGLGYFTVEAIPAAEMADGTVLVGVGRKLYRAVQFPDRWETAWDGEDLIMGWTSGVSSILAARDNTVHLGFRSTRYGYNDLYLTSSTDMKKWTEPLFTTVHDSVGSAVDRVAGSQYLEEGPDGAINVIHYPGAEQSNDLAAESPFVVRSTLDVAALRQDSDTDGLPDAVEERLLTNPRNPDSDGDRVPDSKDLNPLAGSRVLGESERIRQTALERLNYWHERKPDMSRPAEMMIVVTDGDQRQEFTGYPGTILNLSAKERDNYWRRFGRFWVASEEVIITSYVDGGTQATVHTFTGHEAFSMTLNKLGSEWVVTKVQPTFRVY